ncbi:DEAD/DEAH box helicase [Bacillus sp. A301a_S52]|nr:DEAD/DEAH box helicase [Bacillus sp. A301a_S52]
MIRIKQQLFFPHPATFYGVSFDLVPVPSSYSTESVLNDAIWIRTDSLHHIAEIEGTELPFQLDEVFSHFILLMKDIVNTISPLSVYPTKEGMWWFTDELDAKVCTFLWHHAKSETMSTDFKSILHDWLQVYVSHSNHFKEELALYRKTLTMHLSNESNVQSWLNALGNSTVVASIAEPIYPMCMSYWNGTTPEPFQLQLALETPPFPKGDWKLIWYIKEWNSGLHSTLTDIAEGTHPLRQNPVPWLKEEIKRIAPHIIYPLSISDTRTHSFNISHEKVSLFLLHDIKKLEKNGISVLIPDKLIKRVTPQATAFVSTSINDTEQERYTPWIKSHVSWELTLGDISLDEATFRRLVAEQRQLLYINHQWVLWNADMANHLLNYIDLTNANTDFSFTDAIRHVFNAPLSEKDAEQANSFVTWELTEKTKKTMAKQKESLHHLISKKWLTFLKPYQQIGVDWLLNMRELQLGCCLADDMGLGKTIQVISYLDTIVSQSPDTRVTSPFLILCPSSLIHHWEKELKTFASHLNVYVHSGPPMKREDTFTKIIASSHVVICSYAVAVRDRTLMIEHSWGACIYDEAQMLKNSRTKQRHTVKSLHAQHVIALTGTPVENHPSDIWSLMDILVPGLLKDEATFYKQFIYPAHNHEKEDRLEKLRMLTRPFILRRTKEQFSSTWQLPEKVAQTYSVQLTSEQITLYKAVLDDWKDNSLNIPDNAQHAMIFKTMTKLKQICNHPGQLVKDRFQNMYEKERSFKWDKAVDLLVQWMSANKRGLIFTQYRFIGELFQAYAKSMWQLNIPFFHGGLSSENRRRMIETFQTSESVPFMVISLRAGGFGLNLTQATEVLHYDRWWNPAVEAQATDRVHRIGQQHPVTIHTIITKGTIEERIEALINEKRKLQQAVLDGRPLPIWQLTNEELTELFSLT